MADELKSPRSHPDQPEEIPTRRQVLGALGAGALVAAGLLPGCSSSSVSASPAKPAFSPLNEGKIKRAVPLKAHEVRLADVRLGESPFLRAQALDGRYLLSLEPDRMLANFRSNAGLQPKAPVYGGWESVEPWISIRCHGHTLGHYLTGCALMYASTNDVKYKDRVAYCVAELHECQVAGKNGLVCAFPDGATQLENMIAGRRATGVGWYTMHKVFAGLRDAHLYAGDSTALQVLVGLSDWAENATRAMTDEQFERMLGIEHGGMNEVLADVYALTGDEKYLKLAQRFCHRAVLNPLSESRDTLDRLHSNTQIPKFIGFNRLYGLTGDPKYLAASKFFWETVTKNRSFATGGNGDNEHFFPVGQFRQALGSGKTMETCCSYNMLRLTRMLFSLDPSPAYADYYERTLYNTILASQDPDSGMFTYFQPTRPGYLKFYCTPTDSFWCCTGSGMESHAKYGDSIYFHSESGLYVNLFIPSTLDLKERGVVLTQKTRFPEEGKIRLEITAKQPTKMTVSIRHPSWCSAATVRINGGPLTNSTQPGSYITLDRTWRSGDVVDVDQPMTLRTEPLPGSPDMVAIVYGPIVLAGMLGKDGITPGADLIRNERTIGQVLNAQVEVPLLVGDRESILQKVKPVAGQPLMFRTEGLGRPRDVTLIPYFRIAHERYTLYWNLTAAG